MLQEVKANNLEINEKVSLQRRNYKELNRNMYRTEKFKTQDKFIRWREQQNRDKKNVSEPPDRVIEIIQSENKKTLKIWTSIIEILGIIPKCLTFMWLESGR